MKRLLFAGLAGAVLVGCGAVASETTISEDGSFERKVTVTMADTGELPGAESPDPSEMVRLNGADGWTTETLNEGGGSRFIANRSFSAGENEQTGYSLLSGENPFVTCEVVVTKLANGFIEYTETYTWVGETPEGVIEDEEMLADLEKHLKPIGATDGDVQKIAEGTIERMWPNLFGPKDTLMIEMFVNTTVIERKMMRLVGASILGAVEEVLPNTTAEQRLTAVRGIIADMKVEDIMQTTPEGMVDNPMDMPAEGEEEGSDDDMVGLSAVVKGPGRLVETNGEYDPITGEVFWNFYSMAAALGPVVLKAVFDPSG